MVGNGYPNSVKPGADQYLCVNGVEMSELIKSSKGRQLFALLALLGVFGGFWWTYGSYQQVNASEHDSQIPDRPMYYDMRPLVVNIASGSTRNRYLKIRPTLEVRQLSHFEQMADLEPLIRNSLLSLYTQTTPQDLLGDEGFENLRQQSLDTLQTMLEKEMGSLILSDVLFTEYVIQ